MFSFQIGTPFARSWTAGHAVPCAGGLEAALCHFAVGQISLKDVFLHQKRVIRSMLGMHFTDSCRSVFKSLRILTVTSLYILEVCTFIYIHKHSFPHNADVHSLNTRSRHQFYIQFARLSVSRNLPKYTGLMIFNRLPTAFRDQPTLSSFKRHLKDFLFENVFYTLEFFTSG